MLKNCILHHFHSCVPAHAHWIIPHHNTCYAKNRCATELPVLDLNFTTWESVRQRGNSISGADSQVAKLITRSFVSSDRAITLHFSVFSISYLKSISLHAKPGARRKKARSREKLILCKQQKLLRLEFSSGPLFSPNLIRRVVIWLRN